MDRLCIVGAVLHLVCRLHLAKQSVPLTCHFRPQTQQDQAQTTHSLPWIMSRSFYSTQGLGGLARLTPASDIRREREWTEMISTHVRRCTYCIMDDTPNHWDARWLDDGYTCCVSFKEEGKCIENECSACASHVRACNPPTHCVSHTCYKSPYHSTNC